MTPTTLDIKQHYDDLLKSAVQQPGVGMVMELMKVSNAFGAVVARAQFVTNAPAMTCSTNGSSQPASRF